MIRGIDPLLVGDLFYTKLFTDHPSLRHMFPEKMNEQYRQQQKPEPQQPTPASKAPAGDYLDFEEVK